MHIETCDETTEMGGKEGEMKDMGSAISVYVH
jgi:hypothetical protein